MGRDELLRQKKARDEAQKELERKYKNPASIKYDLYNESGNKCGSVEYAPQSDKLILYNGSITTIEGTVLKSLRDVLNKILD